jgi:amino acid permease
MVFFRNFLANIVQTWKWCRQKVQSFFEGRFWSSTEKVFLILVFMFTPLLLNLLVAYVTPSDKTDVISSKIVPGEMLAYCLSLIAPLFFLILKTHGIGFKIPVIKSVFVTAFLLYFAALILTLIAKNELIPGIDFNGGHKDLYFIVSLTALALAILLRFFTEYHDSRLFDYKASQAQQQRAADDAFRNSIPN